MKNVRSATRAGLVFALLLFCLSCTTSAQPTDTFSLKSATGDSTFEIRQHAGKYVALHFLLKTECPFCLRYTHAYAVLSEKDPEVVHVFIKPDDEDEIRKWAGKIDKKTLSELPVIYRDPNAELAAAFRIPDGYQFHGQNVRYPALILLDGNAKEVFRYVGKSNSDRMGTKEFTEKVAELRGVAAKDAAAVPDTR
jgi:peroxiredoxin Q/BCP